MRYEMMPPYQIRQAIDESWAVVLPPFFYGVRFRIGAF